MVLSDKAWIRLSSAPSIANGHVLDQAEGMSAEKGLWPKPEIERVNLKSVRFSAWDMVGKITVVASAVYCQDGMLPYNVPLGTARGDWSLDEGGDITSVVYEIGRLVEANWYDLSTLS